MGKRLYKEVPVGFSISEPDFLEIHEATVFNGAYYSVTYACGHVAHRYISQPRSAMSMREKFLRYGKPKGLCKKCTAAKLAEEYGLDNMPPLGVVNYSKVVGHYSKKPIAMSPYSLFVRTFRGVLTRSYGHLSGLLTVSDKYLWLEAIGTTVLSLKGEALSFSRAAQSDTVSTVPSYIFAVSKGRQEWSDPRMKLFSEKWIADCLIRFLAHIEEAPLHELINYVGDHPFRSLVEARLEGRWPAIKKDLEYSVIAKRQQPY